MKTKHTPAPIQIGSFVEDLSGIIGEVIMLHNGNVYAEVVFDPNVHRTLKLSQLKVAKYSPKQVDKMRAAAPELLEALEYFIKCHEREYMKCEIPDAIEKAKQTIKKATT